MIGGRDQRIGGKNTKAKQQQQQPPKKIAPDKEEGSN
jgi:hypothetical protein